jgi:hypothetical protein
LAEPDRAFLAFAGSVFVFHQLPALSGNAGDWVDLFTPFAVIGSSALVLRALRADGIPLAVGFVAALLYVDGHGIHLAANSIGHEDLHGEAKRVTHFWDERFGHYEALVGWLGLLTAFSLAQKERTAFARRVAVATVALLGWTFFTSTVEGSTWPLLLVALVPSAVWAGRSRRTIVVTAAASLLLAAALIGVWAIWQDGVPQFTEAGFL